MDGDTKSNTQGRLKRIAGQVAGVQRMLDEDRPYAEILVQLAAVQAALLETARTFLLASAEGVFSEAFQEPDVQQRKKQVNALLGLFARYFQVREAEP